MDRPLTAGSDTALRLAGLTVAFVGTTVVSGVDLTVGRGELLAVIGRSGSGKTTLLRAINPLNDCFAGAATSGRVQVNVNGRWHEVYGPGALPLTALRRRVGMVFQTPNMLPVSIEGNFKLPLTLVAGLSGNRWRQVMEQALIGFSVDSDADTRPR
jgi:phosphate transport system ATP-binding protein